MSNNKFYAKALRDLAKITDGHSEEERKQDLTDNLILLEHLDTDDAIQYMIALQMTAAHNKAVDQIALANEADNDIKRNRHLSQASGLMDLFIKQVAARDAYRHRWSIMVANKSGTSLRKLERLAANFIVPGTLKRIVSSELRARAAMPRG